MIGLIRAPRQILTGLGFRHQHLKRTGWVIRNVDDCETVAGHMYRMAMMTYLLDDVPDGDDDDADGAKLDRAKCLELGT